MTEPLSAMFAAHKPVVLGVAAAGVVGLALLKKKSSSSSSSSSTSQPAGTIPAAAVVSSGSVQSAYPDTTASDVYNSLQPTLAQILNQQANQTSAGTSAPLTAPKPIASTLFAPTGSGKYVKYGNGTTGEIESDGSVYGISSSELSADQWAQVQSTGVTALPWQNQMAGGPSYSDRVHNLAAAGGNPITNG